VRAVLAQRLFVEKANLPSPLLNEIKRLAAFQNPEFYKKQSLRFSTAMTPRVIACAEELAQHVALPRGCVDDLKELLQAHGVELQVEDRRQEGEALQVELKGELTAVQQQAAQALLQHDIGVFVAPPGVGKTVLGTYLVAKRASSTLVLVHRQPLLDQWVAQLSMFLGVKEKEIGQIGGGKRKPNGRLDVAMIQSLVRQGRVEDLVETYGHVIVDECHHVPAVSFERVLSEVKARYVLGLTATPHRRDGHHPILEMQLGPVRFAVDPRSQAARRPFDHRLIVRETLFRLEGGGAEAGIQGIYAALAADEGRNRLILDDVLHALEEGRSPILLTERRDHLEYFAEQLRGFVRHLIVLQGGMTAKERRELGARLAAVPDGEERLVLATGRYIGEGFDDPRLDTLILAVPVSWKGTLVQYTGRLHRLHPRKSEVRIFDYVDREVPVLARMFERRLRTYRAIGYVRGEAGMRGVGAGEAGVVRERTVEYDEEAVRYFGEGE
jgi:superfamily II DNA or RNA helicase